MTMFSTFSMKIKNSSLYTSEERIFKKYESQKYLNLKQIFETLNNFK